MDDGDELSVRQLLEEPGVLQLQEVVQDDLPCPRFQTLAACGPGHLQRGVHGSWFQLVHTSILCVHAF